jgi:hypothetical protein
MYVYFGKPRSWWVSPIAIIGFFRWILGYPQPDYISEKPWFRVWDRRMRPWCEWARKQGIRWFPTPHTVRVDEWDLYSPKDTFSDVMVPVLKRFKEKTCSFPVIDQTDLPENMRVDQEEGDYVDRPEQVMCLDDDEPSLGMQQWHFILDEIIWSLEQEDDDFLNELRQHRGPLRERLINGHRLLGKYYRHLWY